MTTQMAEVLEREDGAPELPDLELFGVHVGDINAFLAEDVHPFMKTVEPKGLVISSALWRGYIATYRLRLDGRLMVVRVKYPFYEVLAPRTVNQTLEGDFWLDLSESFCGAGIRVPFLNGQLVEDTEQWRTSDGLPLVEHYANRLSRGN